MPRRRAYETHFSVRVTRAELAALTARARANRLSLSRYLVEAGLGAPETLPDPALRQERERALFHLRKVGTNLNQLARRLNSGGPVATEQLAATLQAVRTAAEALRWGYREGA
jgi:hypothetical protein